MSETQELLRFGVFELNVTTEELRKSGILIRLAPQPLKLLALLARRSGQVVAREEIQQTLWGDETYVDFEQGMNHCIKQIRNALSDSADAPLYVETIPRRGYRFLAPVVTKTIPAPPPRVVESTSGIQTQVPMPAFGSTTVVPSHAAIGAAGTNSTVVVKAPVTDPAPAIQAPPVDRVKQPSSRLRWIVPAIAGLLVIAVAIAIFYWRSRHTASLNLKDSIVIGDFENTRGASEACLGAALQPALGTGNSRSFHAVGRA